MAAKRAEFEIFSASAAHASHAIFTHYFFAMRASMRDGGRRVPRAKQFAILENDCGALRTGTSIFGISTFTSSTQRISNITHREGLASHQPRSRMVRHRQTCRGGFAIATTSSPRSNSNAQWKPEMVE